MIAWHPDKEEIAYIQASKIALLLTPKTERILTGTENDIQSCLEGHPSNERCRDITRPLGSLALSLALCREQENDWREVLKKTDIAQEILSKPIHLKSPIEQERQAEEILRKKYATDNPLYQYAADRIWHEYWALRGKRDSKGYNNLTEFAMNLVKPFEASLCKAEPEERILIDHELVRQLNTTPSDGNVQNRPVLIDGFQTEYILADNSFVPLLQYYQNYLDQHRAVCASCLNCRKLFASDTKKEKYCGDKCKLSAKLTAKAKRENDKTAWNVEKLCRNADAKWNYKSRRIAQSGTWTEDELLQFRIAMDHYQDERKEKRAAYKQGKITIKELDDWLFSQPDRINEVINRIRKG